MVRSDELGVTSTSSPRRHTTPRSAFVASVAVIAIGTWPQWWLRPTTGLDVSWNAALELAAHGAAHLQRPLVFTYGPLGFLSGSYLFSRDSGLATVAAMALLHLATAILLVALWYRLGRGRWLTIVGGYFTLLCVGQMGEVDVLPMLAALWGCLMMARDPTPPPRRVIVALSFLTGTLLLVKFSSGLALASTTVLFTLLTGWRDRIRLLAIAAVCTVGTVNLLFAATGHSPSRLPQFFSTSLEITQGYGKYMGIRGPNFLRDYAIAMLLSAVLIAAALASQAWRDSWRSLLPLVPPLVFGLKHSFVRYDGGHTRTYFVLLLLTCLLMLSVHHAGQRRRDGTTLLTVSLVAGAMVVSFSGQNPAAFVDPVPHGRALARQMSYLVSPWRLDGLADKGRASLRRKYKLDPLLPYLTGQRVDIEPFEAAAAWAYPEIRWNPVPVFQRYSVYTPALDSLNARTLLDDRTAPTVILQQTPRAIDGRNPFFEAPSGLLATVCHYEELAVEAEWQLLRRIPSRCGRERALTTVTADLNEEIAVPQSPPGHILVARVAGLGLGGFETLSSLLFQAPTTSVATNGNFAMRLVPAEGAGPLLMAAPSSLGWSPDFAPPPPVRSLRFSRSGVLAKRHLPLRIRFAVIPLQETSAVRPA
jgi:hypothetical protein